MNAAEAGSLLDALERYVAYSAPGANPEALEQIGRAVTQLRHAPGANRYSLAAIEHWSGVYFSDRQHGLYAGGAAQVRRFILDDVARLRSTLKAA